MRFTYLLIDFFTILVPLMFSFHPRLGFWRTWPAFFPAALITGLFFVLWDAYFTSIKVWGFNSNYLTGLRIGNLPVEEVLFFICIPYSCVFTYRCFSVFIKTNFSKKPMSVFTAILIAASMGMAVAFKSQLYTAYTFLFLSVLLFVAQFWIKVTWLPKFYITYLVLLVPFLLVNGLLTGTGLSNPVVWYNNSQTMSLRILTIPVEDIFYGCDLILLNVLLYNTLLNQNHKLQL